MVDLKNLHYILGSFGVEDVCPIHRYMSIFTFWSYTS